MKREDVLKQLTTPIGAPAYPRGPFRFNNREYLNILYRTDMDALRAVVPEPLEIDEPLVRWEIMRMPDTAGLVRLLRRGRRARRASTRSAVTTIAVTGAGCCSRSLMSNAIGRSSRNASALTP
jgi:hypothetical protein